MNEPHSQPDAGQGPRKSDLDPGSSSQDVGQAGSRRQQGRETAMDAILRTVLGESSGQTSSDLPQSVIDRSVSDSARSRRVVGRSGLMVAVAVLAVAVMFVLLKPGGELDTDQLLPGSPRGNVSAGGRAQDPIATEPHWTIIAGDEADYEAIDATHIALRSGEIQVVGKQPASTPIEVSTATGKVVTSGDMNFRIGHHELNRTSTMHKNILRVFILAGAVTLMNAEGQLNGTAGQLLAAVPGVPPKNVALTANNRFAFEMYRKLAEEEGNIFFSPYSISVALSMTIEGARGRTAEQMAAALQIPEEARPAGSGLQKIPMDFLALHTGHRDLSRLWQRDDAATLPLRKEVEKLQQELAAANARVTELQKQQKYTEARLAEATAQKLADQVNERLSKLDQFELRVSNSLWGDKSYQFNPRFLQTIEESYGTGAFKQMDFRNKGAQERRPINQWVSEQTNGMIPELLQERLMTESQWQRVRLILTNAIYFRGEWTDPFPEDLTRLEPFFVNGTDEKQVPLMHSFALEAGYCAVNSDGTFFETPTEVPAIGELPKCYPDDGGLIVLEVTYKGGDLSMVFILPRTKDGLKSAEQMISPENLQAWIKTAGSRRVNTWIPKFKLNEQALLASVLKSTGMVDAFEEFGPNRADFTGIAASGEQKDSLFISEVVHSATIEVSEKGTEAAAATAVVMANPRSIPATRPFTPEFRADHPFLFLIRDRRSDAILFMGRLTNP